MIHERPLSGANEALFYVMKRGANDVRTKVPYRAPMRRFLRNARRETECLYR